MSGKWRTRHHFFEDNQQLRVEAAELEERTRRRDLVVDDQVIYDFYDARVPADITSGAHFDRWWRMTSTPSRLPGNRWSAPTETGSRWPSGRRRWRP